MTTPQPGQRVDAGLPAAPFISEDHLLATVIGIAKANNFLCYHTWRSTHSQAGYPDLCCVRNERNADGGVTSRLIYIELKSSRGRVSPAQREWLQALSQVPGVEVYCWTPEDLALAEEVLR